VPLRQTASTTTLNTHKKCVLLKRTALLLNYSEYFLDSTHMLLRQTAATTELNTCVLLRQTATTTELNTHTSSVLRHGATTSSQVLLLLSN
jgi:hypothetical protein